MKLKKLFIFMVLATCASLAFCEWNDGPIFNIRNEKCTKNLFKTNDGQTKVAYCFNLSEKKLDEGWDISFTTGLRFYVLENESCGSDDFMYDQGYGFISDFVPTVQKLMLEYNAIAIKSERKSSDGKRIEYMTLYLIRYVKDGDGEVFIIHDLKHLFPK